MPRADLTLHADLDGVSNAEPSFIEQNVNDFSFTADTTAATYSGRFFRADGLFVSDKGTNFTRVPGVFTTTFAGTFSQTLDLDKFFALNGLTFGSDAVVRWQAHNRSFETSIWNLDDVSLGPDTTGPTVTALATDNGSFATVVLNDRFSAFDFTFDDRLDPTSATDPTNYELVFAEPDGVFDNDDDEVISLGTPVYDGDFMVALPITKSVPEGLIRLTIQGHQHTYGRRTQSPQ